MQGTSQAFLQGKQPEPFGVDRKRERMAILSRHFKVFRSGKLDVLRNRQTMPLEVV
jgi:hypothetical protein